MATKAKFGARVGIIMGSVSDWKTLAATAAILDEFGVPYEKNVVSAHRTPHWLAEYAGGAKKRGLQVIIAGAGGAAHLPGMAAAFTTLPVLGVPVESKALKGLDSLLVHRADARGRAGGNAGHRRAGGKKCRVAGHFHPGVAGRKIAPCVGNLPREANADRAGTEAACKREMEDEPDSSRLDHRLPGRRPARAHVRPGGAQDGVSRAYGRSDARQSDGTDFGPRIQRALHRHCRR